MPLPSPMTWRCLGLCVVAGALLGCPPRLTTCRSDGDCPSAQLCRARQCRAACNSALDCTRREACVDGACRTLATTDAAGVPDTSTRDAVIAESGSVDNQRADLVAPDQVASADTALPDAASVDTPRVDTLAADAAQPDSALVDATPTDAPRTDGVPADLVSLDQIIPDVATVDVAVPDVASGLERVAGDGPLGVDSATATDLGSGLDLALSDQGAADPGAGSGDAAPTDAPTPPCSGSPPGELCPSADVTLRACYPFDDDVLIPDSESYRVPDHSSSSNDGLGTGIDHQAGVQGLAARFAGAETVSVADDPSLDIVDQVTLEAWIYPEAWPATGARMGILDKDGQYAVFLRPLGAVSCSTGSGSNQPQGGVAPLDTWTHVACVRSSDALRLYLDGRLIFTQELTVMNPAGTSPLNVGANSPSGDHFVGRIDSVRVWSRGLTADEVCWAAQR